MVAGASNPRSVAPSAGTHHETIGPYRRRLPGGEYALVVALVVVGVLWLLIDGALLAYAGVNFFPRVTFLCVAAAVVAIPLRSNPRWMSTLLSAAAAGVLLIAGLSMGDTTNVGSSGICSDDFANAVARVPDGYWTWWVVLGALTGVAMVVGALLTPRTLGSGLLGAGAFALAVGTLVLWVSLNEELKRVPASFPVGRCGEPLGLSGEALGLGGALVLTAPVALLALAAVIPAIWSRPFERPALADRGSH